MMDIVSGDVARRSVSRTIAQQVSEAFEGGYHCSNAVVHGSGQRVWFAPCKRCAN